MFVDLAKSLLEKHLGNISIYQPTLSNQGSFGSFQLTLAEDRSWIHSDPTSYIGLVYLNPNPPLDTGTAFYRHKETGHESNQGKNDLYDLQALDNTKWDMTDNIGNKYNRCVIYKSDLFHAPRNYFGNDIQSGRLYQLFFFDINSDK